MKHPAVAGGGQAFSVGTRAARRKAQPDGANTRPAGGAHIKRSNAWAVPRTYIRLAEESNRLFRKARPRRGLGGCEASLREW